MLIISFIGFSIYDKIIINDHMSLIYQLNKQANDKLDDYVEDIIEISKVPLYYQSMINNFAQNKEISLSDTEQGWESIIQSTIFAKKDVYAVNFFYADGSNFGKSQTGFLSNRYNPKDEEWFKAAFTDKKNIQILTSNKFPYDYPEKQDKNQYYISVVRPLFSIFENKVVALEMITIKNSLFENLCSGMKTTDSHRIMLTNQEDTIIYDTQKDSIDKTASTVVGINLLDSQNSDNLKTKAIKNNKYIITKHTSELTGLTIVGQVLTKEIINDAQTNAQLILIISIVVYMLILAAVIIFFGKITAPLSYLNTIMTTMVQENTLDKFIDISGNNRDEVWKLSNAYNHLIKHINSLIDKINLTNKRNKDLEFALLQNQINPHFLYNTLESIHMMAEINNDIETSKMAIALGKTLRYGISIDKKTASVADEIKHIENYVYIQKIHLNDMLKININIDSAITKNEILKLTLQPLVENSIKHGFYNKTEMGTISIKGYASSEKMIFIVQDDGVGIDEENLNVINQMLKNNEIDENYIGLTNVNYRIKAYYGEQYGVEVFSIVNKGTIVKIILPNE